MSENEHIGLTSFPRPATPYEKYMQGEGLPVHRDAAGFPDVRKLALGDWARLGGRGAFIELEGVGNLQGIWLLEIPAGGALNPERHLYEEIFYVVEGSGYSEVWLDGHSPDRIDWHANSVFTVPLNAWHRHVATSAGEALLLVGSNAPPTLALFQSSEFVFGDSYQFVDRFRPGTGYYNLTGLKEHPMNGRALYDDTVIPDATTVELPFDGQRGAGYRHIELEMSGNFYKGWVGEYPPGRYSRAHAHESGAILVCLAGAGYTLSWPKALGVRPWQDRHASEVVRTDYGPGGIVSAAPGGADWFHAHFGVSRTPFRAMALSGGFVRRVKGGPGTEETENQDMRSGGDTIGYADEDPEVRHTFQQALAAAGVPFDMPAECYQPLETLS